MTQEDKRLLLIDLAARVPYGVRVLVRSHKGTFNGTLVTVTTKLSSTLGEAWIEETNEALWCDYSLFKPYLRPLSSMTEEEIAEYNSLFTYDGIDEYCFLDYIDWLNTHHFDFRGLIQKDLALEAKEGMYN